MRVFSLIFIGGCTAFATYQTPIVTPKDEVSFGFSISGFFVNDTSLPFPGIPLSIPSFMLRYGVTDNSDIGFLFTGFPVFGSTTLDYKYQFLNNNGFLGAFDIGSGFWFFPSEERPLFVYPFFGLSFGNERIYVALRGTYNYFSQRATTVSTFSGSMILGATLGKGPFRFSPELSFVIPFTPEVTGDIPLPIRGFSFIYSFGFLYIPKK